jgi:hypothetical protein
MNRRASAQIGEPERRLPVAAVRRAEEREQRRVLRDREDLPLAECPAARREVAGEDHDLADERIGVHGIRAGRLRLAEQGAARDEREHLAEEAAAGKGRSDGGARGRGGSSQWASRHRILRGQGPNAKQRVYERRARRVTCNQRQPARTPMVWSRGANSPSPRWNESCEHSCWRVHGREATMAAPHSAARHRVRPPSPVHVDTVPELQ